MVLAVFTAVPALAQGERARTLHDTYCVMCHGTQAYTRPDRVANDYDSIRGQVDRWQKNVRLNWSDKDIDLVAIYLAQRFYKVPCPADC
jgi:hypothetical protein